MSFYATQCKMFPSFPLVSAVLLRADETISSSVIIYPRNRRKNKKERRRKRKRERVTNAIARLEIGCAFPTFPTQANERSNIFSLILNSFRPSMSACIRKVVIVIGKFISIYALRS